MTTPSLHAVLAERLRVRREELGLTQDALARRMRVMLGTTWSQSVVASIEAARRELTLTEVVMMCAALETGLAELVREAGDVALGDWEGDAGEIVARFAGEGEVAEVLVNPRFAAAMETARKAYAARAGQLWPGSKSVQWVRAERAIGEAETKAARKLGYLDVDVTLAAHGLWGRSLTEERDARVTSEAPANASPRSIQALRGHVTRELLLELEPRLKQGRHR